MSQEEENISSKKYTATNLDNSLKMTSVQCTCRGVETSTGSLCERTLAITDKFCSNCGAPNVNYQSELHTVSTDAAESRDSNISAQNDSEFGHDPDDSSLSVCGASDCGKETGGSESLDCNNPRPVLRSEQKQGATKDNLSIYDIIPLPRPVEDVDPGLPGLPPRSKISTEVSAPSLADSSLSGSNPYETPQSTFTVQFHLAVGEAYKINTDTDKVFICLGNKPRKMKINRILSKKLVTYELELEISRADMTKLGSIPYGYELHRLEATRANVERETLKHDDLQPFRHLMVDKNQVPYLDVLLQMDGLMNKGHTTKALNIFKRKHSTKSPAEVLQVIQSWLPQWDGILDGIPDVPIAEYLVKKVTRLVECTKHCFVIDGGFGTGKTIGAQVIAEYIAYQIRSLKMSMGSNLMISKREERNPNYASISSDNLTVPWSTDDTVDNLLKVIKRSYETDERAGIRMAVAMGMVYLLDVNNVSLENYKHEMNVLMCALLCKTGIKNPKADFEGVKKHFPNMYKDLLLNLQNLMSRLAGGTNCEPLWVLALPLYHYYMDAVLAVDDIIKPLDKPWAPHDLIKIIDDFHKTGQPTKQHYELYKTCFEPLYTQCSILRRTLLLVLSLEKLAPDNINDHSTEDILCQIHWRAERQLHRDVWADMDSVSLKPETTQNVVELLVARIEDGEAEVEGHVLEIEWQKQYAQKQMNYCELCTQIIHKFCDNPSDVSCYSNIGLMLDLVGQYWKSTSASVNIIRDKLQSVDASSEEGVKLEGAAKRAEYNQETALMAIQDVIDGMVTSMLPKQASGIQGQHKEHIKVKSAFMKFTTNEGQNIVMKLLQAQFEKLTCEEQLDIYCHERLEENISRTFAAMIIQSLLGNPQMRMFSILSREVQGPLLVVRDRAQSVSRDRALVLMSTLLEERIHELHGRADLDTLTWPLLSEYIELYKGGKLDSHTNHNLRIMIEGVRGWLEEVCDPVTTSTLLQYRPLLAVVMELFYGKSKEDIAATLSGYEENMNTQSAMNNVL